MDEPQSQPGSVSAWIVLWSLALCSAIAGIIAAGVVVGGLWPFGGHGWLLVPFLFLPVAIPALTASQSPGKLAAALAMLAALAVAVLGLVSAGLLAWAEAHDWQGDRCCEAVFSTPWTTWQAMMLAYAGLGVALFGLLVVSLRRMRAGTRIVVARPDGGTS
jgi:hypothetical protein